MKLKDLIKIMYYNTRIALFDTNGRFNCCLAYRGVMRFIPDKYKEREVRIIDSGTAYIYIFLEG